MAFIIVMAFLPCRTGMAQSEVNLMPMPAQVTIGDGNYKLPSDLKISITGQYDPRLTTGLDWFMSRLESFSQGETKSKLQPDQGQFRIIVDHPGKLSKDEDESYTLLISEKGISLQAPTDLGALHGLETLLQLLYKEEGSWRFQTVSIEDQPRFAWRGLLIDVGRHFMPLQTIKRNIDGMAMVKLNVLHFHLTEDQGFRIESKIYPKLHQEGSNGYFFTQEQIKDIIHYADQRGIRVVPEFDMPGHTTSWFVSHPELASAPGPYAIETHFGIFGPAMDPTRETTYDFLDNFLGEMADLFPDSYLHIGGDEVNGEQWDNNPHIQSFMKEKGLADNNALQQYFNTRVQAILTKHGKNMVGWDEILHPGLSDNVVIQSWRGKESLYNAAKQGYNTILSNGYYIDLCKSAAIHYQNDPIPPDADINESQVQHILGGEATMWAELVDSNNIDSRIWPRAAAVAERLWSPSSVNDISDMYRRLHVVNQELSDAGLHQNSYYLTLLEDIAGSKNYGSLKTLVDLLEPVEGYARHRYKKYTTSTPLNRVVDAAKPDSREARLFNEQIIQYLGDSTGNSEDIRKTLTGWISNDKALKELAMGQPRVEEILPQSEHLAKLAQTGLTALDVLEGKKPAPSPDWNHKQLLLIKSSGEPVAETELKITPGIEKLLVAMVYKD